MGRFFLYLAGALFLVTLGALVNSQTTAYFLLLALAGTLATIGWGLGTRWVQERIPGLSTPATRYRAVYDDLQRIRRGIREARANKGDASRDTWEPQIREWDADFWQFVRRDFYTRASSIEIQTLALSTLADKRVGDDIWASRAVEFLLKRRNMLDALEEDLPK